MRPYLGAAARRRAAAVAEAEPETEGWSDVTPADADLTAGGDCFGASGYPVVDPTNPARIWFGVDLQGIWMSSDYGATFSKVSEDDSIVENGKIWALAIAYDGSAMWAASGAGSQFLDVLKSTSLPLGQTWAKVATGIAFEPYGFNCSPTNANRLCATAHYPGGEDSVFESTNGGASWTNIGSTGSGSQSGYAYYGLTDATIIHVADGDTPAANSTKRATRSGSTWSAFAGVDNTSHYHGSHQLLVDRVNGLIWNPGPGGIKLSDDDGVTWTSVSTVPSASIAKSRARMLAGASYASQGSFNPRIQEATYPDGDTWTERTDEPAGMTNGPRAMCVTVNAAGQDVFILCNWTAPIYRFVGPVA
jgi:hypothetical protein